METVFNQSLWGDEAFSAILSMKSIPDILRIIARDTSPPLFNLTEYLAFQIFGTDETVIRGLVFVYYLLTVFFVYKIGALVWSRKTGLFAAVLTFLNPFFFIYAFEGRMYSIMALGVAASMYFFIKSFVEKEGGIGSKIGYVLATSWALYSHHFAIFILFVQGLWFIKEILSKNFKTARSMFKSFVAIGILYIPWLIPLYGQMRMVGGGFWLGTPTLTDMRTIIYDYLAQGIKHPLSEPALYIVFVLLLIRDWTKKINISLLFLLWFLLPIAAAWGISQSFTSVFFNRYLLYTIPGAMLILATNKRVPASNIIIFVLLIMFAVIDYRYFTTPDKRPFRQLASYVLETREEGDYLINWYSNGAHHIWETKYYKIPAPIYVEGDDHLPYFVGTALMEDGDIVNTIPNNAKRVGVITSGPIEEVDLNNYTKKEIKEFKGIKFIWLTKE